MTPFVSCFCLRNVSERKRSAPPREISQPKRQNDVSKYYSNCCREQASCTHIIHNDHFFFSRKTVRAAYAQKGAPVSLAPCPPPPHQDPHARAHIHNPSAYIMVFATQVPLPPTDDDGHRSIDEDKFCEVLAGSNVLLTPVESGIVMRRLAEASGRYIHTDREFFSRVYRIDTGD